MRTTHSSEQQRNGIEVNWCVPLFKEYQNVTNTIKNGSVRRINNSQNRWVRPPTNCLKMSVDAAVKWDSIRFAVGGVMRDHDGRMVLALGQKISKPSSTRYAELVAIKEGIRTALNYRLEIHEVITYSLLTVQTVANPEVDFSYVGH